MKKILLLLIAFVVSATCYAVQPNDFKKMVDLIKDEKPEQLRQVLSTQTKQDINFSKKNMLLTLGVSSKNTEIVGILLDWGISADRLIPVQKDFNVTPLLLAISSNAGKPMVEVLIRHGADVNKPAESILPMNFALSMRQYAVAEYLLQHGANPNGMDATAKMTQIVDLVVSAQEADIPAVLYLIDKLVQAGAKIDAQDSRGNTALYFAALAGKVSVVRSLLEHGADANIGNDKGETPLQAAKKKQWKDITELLLQHGAKE